MNKEEKELEREREIWVKKKRYRVRIKIGDERWSRGDDTGKDTELKKREALHL